MNKKASKLTLLTFMIAFLTFLCTLFSKGTSAIPNKSYPEIYYYPVASDIYIGCSLKDSTLSGGQANVPGTFSWKDPEFTPTKKGINSCTVIFTPNDLNNYYPIEHNININVTKCPFVLNNPPRASDIYLGQPLSESTLTFGLANTPGAFVWESPYFIPQTPGEHKCPVVFIPTDENNYERGTIYITVTVKHIIRNNPKASNITFGEPLQNSVLKDGWACVPGKFEWQNPALVLNAGKYKCGARFIPNDLNKFKTINFDLEVTVLPAPVTVYNYPKATPIIYGQKLSESKIYDSLFNVPGTIDWKYYSDKSKILSAGIHHEWITFTPANSNYAPFSYCVEVNVLKAKPKSPSNISFSAIYKPNMRLNDFQLSDGWEWENPNYLIDFTGSKKFKVYKKETKNYLAARDYVSVNIAKADPKLELSDINYSENQHLYDIRLPQGWSWNNPNIIPDTYTEYYKATFNPDKCNNQFYRFDNNVSVRMKVLKSTPVVKKWIEPASDYVYGTDINTIKQTSGKASVAGTFYWDGMQSNLKIGQNKIFIKFIPSNNNYLPVFGSTYVNVVKNNIPENPPENPNKKITKTDVSISIEQNNNIDKLEYSIDGGKTWESPAIFKNLNPDTVYKFIYRYKDTEFRCAGKNSSSVITIKTKLSAPKAPEKVELIRKTDSLIVLKNVSGLEYSKDGGKTWQDSPTFNNLKENTSYSFVARIKENEEHMASFISKETIIITKLSAPKPPKELEIVQKTNHEILFVENKDQEYSKDGGKTWQDSPHFKNLNGSTNYEFATRLKETDKYAASPMTKKTIKTLSWFKNVFWNKFIGKFIKLSWKK